MLRCMTQLSIEQTQFDRSTTLEPVAGEPGVFAVDLAEEWSSLIGIHGGYMAAIAVRGAEAVAVDRGARTTTTNFLRAGRPGKARLEVREFRRSRSISTVIADVVQGPSVLMTSRVTLTTGASLERAEPTTDVGSIAAGEGDGRRIEQGVDSCEVVVARRRFHRDAVVRRRQGDAVGRRPLDPGPVGRERHPARHEHAGSLHDIGDHGADRP